MSRMAAPTTSQLDSTAEEDDRDDEGVAPLIRDQDRRGGRQEEGPAGTARSTSATAKQQHAAAVAAVSSSVPAAPPVRRFLMPIAAVVVASALLLVVLSSLNNGGSGGGGATGSGNGGAAAELEANEPSEAYGDGDGTGGVAGIASKPLVKEKEGNTGQQQQQQQQQPSPDSSHDVDSSGAGSPPAANLPTKRSASGNAIIDEMHGKFQVAKQKYHNRLKADYGNDAYGTLFFREDGTSRGRTMIRSINATTNVDWERLKRKVSAKIVASAVGRQRRRRLAAATASRALPEDVSPLVPFVWATGGHSAAAGHGNFYNQSYTAYMERAVKGAFEAVGVDFVARNYAMGGHASGPELAFCVKEIYGADFDVLTWDFGMTGTL